MERLLVAATVLAVLILAWLAFRAWRAQRPGSIDLGPEVLGLAGSLPHILYFSGEGCADCRGRQAPALTQLQAELKGGVRVVELDAPAHPDLVQALGILTLPTTVIVDPLGRVRRINDGYADLQKLRHQVQEIQCGKNGG